MSKKIHAKGILAMLVLAFVFASMGLFARYLNTDFTILQQTYLRIFAALILGLVFFQKDLKLKKIISISQHDWKVIIFRSIALYLLGVTLFSYAIVNAKFSNVSFISAVPFVALLGFFFLKEKITKAKIMYILISFFGVLLIAINDYANLLNWGRGEFVALIATFFFSLSYIARKWQSDYLNNKETTVLIFFISTLLLFLLSLFFMEGLPSIQSFSIITIAIILGAGLFNVANLWLTNYGFKHVEAVLAGNILSLEVVFALLLGLIFYREIPTLKELIGGSIIVFSVYRMNKLQH